MDSGGITRASSEGLRLAGPGGRSILLKAGSTETQGAYSLLKLTAPSGSPWSTHHTHPATEAWYVLDGELTFALVRESYRRLRARSSWPQGERRIPR